MLGCTLQACKPWSCPALKAKKEPRDSDRTSTVDWIGDLTHLKQKVLEQHPTLAGWHDHHGSHLRYSEGEAAATIYGELTSGWLISYQGNQKAGQVPHSPSG